MGLLLFEAVAYLIPVGKGKSRLSVQPVCPVMILGERFDSSISSASPLMKLYPPSAPNQSVSPVKRYSPSMR